MSNIAPELKVCLKCGVAYPLDDYRIEMRRGKPYRRPDCRTCRAETSKQYYEANKEKIMQTGRVWAKQNREHVAAKIRQRRRAKTQEKKAARAVVPHPDNIVLISALRRSLKQWSPEKDRAAAHNTRAKNLGIKGRITFFDIQAKLLEQDFFCYLCGAMLEDNYHVDHVLALARGGANDPGNIAIACSLCNWSKNDRDLKEYKDFEKQTLKKPTPKTAFH